MKKTGWATYEFSYEEELLFKRVLGLAVGSTEKEKLEWIEGNIQSWADSDVLRAKIDQLQAELDALKPVRTAPKRAVANPGNRRKPTLADTEVARLSPIMSYEDDT